MKENVKEWMSIPLSFRVRDEELFLKIKNLPHGKFTEVMNDLIKSYFENNKNQEELKMEELVVKIENVKW